MPRYGSVSSEETPTSPKSTHPRRLRPFSDAEVRLTNQSDYLYEPRNREASDLTGLLLTGLPSPPISECGESSSQKYSFHAFDSGNTFSSPPVSESEKSSLLTSSVYGGREDVIFSSSSISHINEHHEALLDSPERIAPDLFPFPIQPAVYGYSNPDRADSGLKGAKSSRQCPSSGTRRLFSSSTPDRYIADRGASQSASRNFHLSKPPHKLSVAEKLLRQNSNISNPFTSTGQPRIRAERTPRSVSLTRQRTPSVTSVLDVPRYLTTTHNRVASIGAVWNVGGNTAANYSGPVQGISDGRGGMIGSGTNAPIYTSNFFEEGPTQIDQDCLEGRLAVALDIDQTNRILNTSQSPDRERRVISNPAGTKRKYPCSESRLRWVDGEWILDGSSALLDAPQLRDDYYCSVLAYSHTSRTLAVGLNHKVYLWSESFGVQFPQIEENSSPETYVSSLSFSSTEGGHSILAIGRNNGQLSLWSLFDSEGVRFYSQHQSAVACLAFKPVATRRLSERFGSLVSMEDLIVGDEAGVVYYYSIEWMTNHDIAIHGWQGAMNLLAKITVHNQQICGLAWSHDGEYLATGANDNMCCLFEVKDILTSPSPQFSQPPSRREPLQALMNSRVLPSAPQISSAANSLGEFDADDTDFMQALHGYVGSNVLPVHRRRSNLGHQGTLTITEGRQKHKWIHSAAIKAIAFCPWQRGLLATGGGSNDRAIHFYHTFSGACLSTINVQAQVTSLIWSTSRREIAATFGYAQPEHPYRIAVFSWPECKQVVAIPWTTDMRALAAISYPGGPNETSRRMKEGETWGSRTSEEGCIVVACSDESVKFHEVWSGTRKATGGNMGLLGGSDILEGLEGIEKEGMEVIR